ncbi:MULTISPECIES: hypothetical protein [unclassified Variovorax]|uniref:phage adaptor protein n=1 Tax=unclassified Variovorax TaxID=663243 RepID=UPI00076D6E28|nr:MULTISPECIES: hypothetical protein [unclassified Variovorax]KWT94683.1 hypothetical protein APY03_2558 [Variovorax sp. WDL1]PNG53178.1 hypothetical protein CHC06_04523 [Variovorax sp. B2]PNG53750.1 hypothetical protein CHC07_03570 [Variovorax sp. B4]VTV11201.1 hypothetical protein WDL1CHR_02084 [Variovorax sp. WDL1]
MTISNYTDLQTAVSAWAARGDSTVVGRVPDFIRLAEERIWQRVRVSWGIASDTLTIVAGQNWVALPDDWLAFKRIRSATEPRIEYMAPDALEDLAPCGNPRAYSLEGGRLLYGQTPSADLVLDVKYYQHPGLLEIAPTNWLLTRAPSVYLYASLLEAAIFVKNPDKVAEFGSLLDKAINGLKGADEAAQISGSRLRMQR